MSIGKEILLLDAEITEVKRRAVNKICVLHYVITIVLCLMVSKMIESYLLKTCYYSFVFATFSNGWKYQEHAHRKIRYLR